MANTELLWDIDFVKVPNSFLEHDVMITTYAQLKIELAILLKTYGARERVARLTYKDFIEITGLSRPSVRNGIEGLIEKGLIEKYGRSKYSLNYKDNSPEVEEDYNFTKVPVSFFDIHLKNIGSKAQLKVMLVVMRLTWGWVDFEATKAREDGSVVYKKQDSIAISQFEEKTDMSNKTIVEGLKRAEEDGYIKQVYKGGHGEGDTSIYKIKPQSEWDIEEEEDDGHKEVEVDIEETEEEEVDNKKETLQELFGDNEEEKDDKKKGYESKPRDLWKTDDFLDYFTDLYEDECNYRPSLKNPRYRANIKHMLEKEDIPKAQVADAIKLFVTEYETIKALPDDAKPKFNIFFGFRDPVFEELAEREKEEEAQKEMDEIQEEQDVGMEWDF